MRLQIGQDIPAHIERHLRTGDKIQRIEDTRRPEDHIGLLHGLFDSRRQLGSTAGTDTGQIQCF